MSWVGGLAQWREGETLFLSVAFTWKLDEAWHTAMSADRYDAQQGLFT